MKKQVIEQLCFTDITVCEHKEIHEAMHVQQTFSEIIIDDIKDIRLRVALAICPEIKEDNETNIIKAMHAVYEWSQAEFGKDERVLGEVINDFLDSINNGK